MSDRLGILDRTLTFIDRPWKALVTIILVLIIGTGWFFWEKRAEIAEAILTKTIAPKLEPQRFDPIAMNLLSQAKADAVMIIQGDLNKNSATNVKGFDRDGKPWLSMTGSRPILFADFPVIQLIRFLAGQTVCNDVVDGGEEMQAEERLGIKRACLTAIPPFENVLVGGLWVGWKNPPPIEVEARAQVLMRDTAAQLASW